MSNIRAIRFRCVHGANQELILWDTICTRANGKNIGDTMNRQWDISYSIRKKDERRVGLSELTGILMMRGANTPGGME